MFSEAWPIVLVLATFSALLVGVPVGFALGGVAVLIALLADGLGAFDSRLLSSLPLRWLGIVTNDTLVAIPLFIVMGITLERSGIAGDLLRGMARWLGGGSGAGLPLSVVLVGGLLAASTGIVGATIVTMGLVSLPALLREGHDPAFAAGTVCAAGTLGQIIPPSIALVILGDVLQGAHQEAELARGNFAPDPVSVVDLFAGALLPGLLLVALYSLWVLLVCRRSVPRSDMRDAEPGDPSAIGTVALPLLLVMTVLGSIFLGLATPTEAAGMGAATALMFSGLARRIGKTDLEPILRRSIHVTSMIFLVLLGASVFSLVFRGLGGDELVRALVAALPGGRTGAVIGVMLLVFAMGFVLELIEIILVVVPLVAPVLLAMDFDPVWLGVMLAVVLQTSFLTPPVGFALFYLRGVAPEEVTTAHIYRGVVPFVAMQLICLAMVGMVPSLATWLPEVLFG